MSVFDIKNRADFDAMYQDEATFTEILMEDGILKKSPICGKCGEMMTTRRRPNGLEWRCRIDKSSECSSMSVRNGSWFARSKLSFQRIFHLLLMHANSYTNKQIQDEMKMSSKTVVDFRHFFRELSMSIYKSQPRIGGNDGIVEVDESCVHARKYGRGQKKKEQVWIFGGKCRTSSHVFAEIVADRTGKTLMKVLKARVKPDTTTYSDGWKGYSEVKRFFKDHGVVNHSLQFKSATGVHTNGIEGFWAHMKKPLKAGNGTTDQLLEYYVADSVVRTNTGDSYIGSILRQMAKSLED